MTDIKIPFWSMVVLLVKWALASIPALIILFAIASIIAAVLNILFGGTFHWYWGPGRSL